MKKLTAIVMTLMLMSGAAMALPKVTLDEECAAYQAINEDAESLLGTLAIFIDDLPEYDQADLELAMAGDKIPDSFELALFAMALCKGGDESEALEAQFAANKTVYNNILGIVNGVVPILLGDDDRDPLGDRLAELAAILTNHPELEATIDGLAGAGTYDGIIEDLTDLAEDVNGILEDVEAYADMIPGLLETLGELGDFVAALAGLSTEMQATVTGLLDDYMGDINDTIDQVTAVQAAFAAVLEAGVLTQDEAAAVTSMSADVTAVVGYVNGPTGLLALLDSIQVFGVAKAGDEPFSAAGDYDGDGNTNLVAFNGSDGSKAGFVAAASGANPYYAGNTNLPAVGLAGLAALAGLVSLGGALSLRKK